MNLGVVVQTAIGPFVPVVEKAETKDIAAISNEVKELAAKVSRPVTYGGCYRAQDTGFSFCGCAFGHMGA